MEIRSLSNQRGVFVVKYLGAIVAAACVASLVGVLWMHTHPDMAQVATTFAAPSLASAPMAPTGSSSPASFLRAPTGDPSLPSLEATMSRPDAAAEQTESAPTF